MLARCILESLASFKGFSQFYRLESSREKSLAAPISNNEADVSAWGRGHESPFDQRVGWMAEAWNGRDVEGSAELGLRFGSAVPSAVNYVVLKLGGELYEELESSRSHVELFRRLISRCEPDWGVVTTAA